MTDVYDNECWDGPYKRITAVEAYSRFKSSQPVFLMASNTRPGGFWVQPCEITNRVPRYDGPDAINKEWHRCANAFHYYKCSDELGLKIHYYKGR